MVIGGGFGAVAARKREDDRDAADGGALQRRRRRRGGARSRSRSCTGSCPTPARRRSTSASRSCSPALIGVDLVRRLDGRVREAAGADQRPPDHVRRPAVRERRALHRVPRRRDRARRGRGSRSGCSGCSSPARSLFGVLFVLPIGGADMPVVISLLNAFTGLAVARERLRAREQRADRQPECSSARPGTLLTLMMGRAMNRSIANVLFGAFGQVTRRRRRRPRRATAAARCAARPPRTSP